MWWLFALLALGTAQGITKDLGKIVEGLEQECDELDQQLQREILRREAVERELADAKRQIERLKAQLRR